MAGARSNTMFMLCMGAMVALIGAVVVADRTAVPVHGKPVGSVVREEGCPEAAYAYPFQSVCDVAAQFDVEYHLVAPFSNALIAKGGLTAGWGSSVSFTGNQSDEGYKFKLTALSSSASDNITLGTTFTVTNTDTDKKLGWQFSAWFRSVVLSFVQDDSSATVFQLARACNVPLPCPETTGARCESYYFLTPGLVGLTGIGSNSGFAFSWIVPSASESSGNLPLLLRRVD